MVNHKAARRGTEQQLEGRLSELQAALRCHLPDVPGSVNADDDLWLMQLIAVIRDELNRRSRQQAG